ncbi:hypothetical protein pb186bvf_013203 [Paramecium bursaria]
MCIEQAFKRGGITLVRNFLHQAEGVKRGLPAQVQSRLNIQYKIRSYQNGKVSDTKYISDLTAGFFGKGDRK